MWVEASVLKRKGARTDRHVHEGTRVTVQRKWWWKSFRVKGRKERCGAVRDALVAAAGQEERRATSGAL